MDGAIAIKANTLFLEVEKYSDGYVYPGWSVTQVFDCGDLVECVYRAGDYEWNTEKFSRLDFFHIITSMQVVDVGEFIRDICYRDGCNKDNVLKKAREQAALRNA